MPPARHTPGRRRGPLGDGFELPHRLPAEQQRNEGADRHHYQYRAEEYRSGAGVGFHQEGRQHPGKDPPGRLAEGMSAPAQRRRELLGEVDPKGGRGRERREASHQRAGYHHRRRIGSCLVRHHHQEKTGQRAGKGVEYRPASADDLHQEAGETFSRYARSEDQRAYAKAQGDGGALIDQRLWQQDRKQKKGSAAEDIAGDSDCRPAKLAPTEQRPIRRQLLTYHLRVAPERCRRQRRNSVAGLPDDPVDGVDRHRGVASAQIPARTFGDQEIDHRRHDKEGEPARQRHQSEGIRITGEQKADEREQRERAG